MKQDVSFCSCPGRAFDLIRGCGGDWWDCIDFKLKIHVGS